MKRTSTQPLGTGRSFVVGAGGNMFQEPIIFQFPEIVEADEVRNRIVVVTVKLAIMINDRDQDVVVSDRSSLDICGLGFGLTRSLTKSITETRQFLLDHKYLKRILSRLVTSNDQALQESEYTLLFNLFARVTTELKRYEEQIEKDQILKAEAWAQFNQNPIW